MKQISSWTRERIIEILEHHGDLKQVSRKGGKCPLTYSVNKLDMDLIRQLLVQDVDINQVDDRGNTPLLHAVKQGSLDIAQLLISRGANVDAQNKEGETCLMHASEYGYEKLIHSLVPLSKDVNTVSLKGRSALHYTVYGFFYSESAAMVLIQHGADINQLFNPTENLKDYIMSMPKLLKYIQEHTELLTPENKKIWNKTCRLQALFV